MFRLVARIAKPHPEHRAVTTQGGQIGKGDLDGVIGRRQLRGDDLDADRHEVRDDERAIHRRRDGGHQDREDELKGSLKGETVSHFNARSVYGQTIRRSRHFAKPGDVRLFSRYETERVRSHPAGCVHRRARAATSFVA